ncbi:MAG: ABC transporter permease [Candidatus Omnitrophica bacterium]|nr:ABC transporter permease [Candidatus Omnitrophota bacterium]
MLKKVFQYRDLLFMLTLRDIRIRYKQAAMGFIWALFMPIVAVCAGILIKYAMANVSGTTIDLLEVVSISVKVLPWTFFISSIRFSVQSLVGNSSLVTKIYFPNAVLPLASTLACLFDFAIAIIVLAVLLTVAQLGVSIYLLWLPVLIIFLFLFTAGLGLLLAAGNLFFRDIKYVVQTMLTFGIFFVPVFYSVDQFGKWSVFLLANPVGSILEAINSVVVLQQMPDMGWFGYAGASSVFMFLIGLRIFCEKEPLFAENI